MVNIHKICALAVFVYASTGHQLPAAAATPDELLDGYATEAKVAAKDFNADAGKKLYLEERTTAKGEKASCAGCHTKDPRQSGKTRAGKEIKPMAIVANGERFTDKAKVEKWFKRNCKDVLERECTAREKGDFIAFMKSVK